MKAPVSVKVGLLTESNYPFLKPSDKITFAREIMRATGHRILPVMEESRVRALAGLLHRIGVLSATSTKSDLKVGDVMSPPLITLSPQENMLSALRRMLEVDEWYAPVLDNGLFEGIFGLDGVLKYIYWELGDSLGRSKCREVMSRTKLVFVAPEESVTRLWHLMLEHKYAGIPVVKQGRLVGVVTQHDLIARGFGRPELESESGPRRTKVSELMKTPAFAVKGEDTLLKAVEILAKKNIGRVFVVDDEGKLVGVIDREDVVRHVLFSRNISL